MLGLFFSPFFLFLLVKPGTGKTVRNMDGEARFPRFVFAIAYQRFRSRGDLLAAAICILPGLASCCYVTVTKRAAEYV